MRGMIGDLSQDLAVDSLSLGQPAGLVMSDGDLEDLLHGMCCHSGHSVIAIVDGFRHPWKKRLCYPLSHTREPP